MGQQQFKKLITQIRIKHPSLTQAYKDIGTLIQAIPTQEPILDFDTQDLFKAYQQDLLTKTYRLILWTDWTLNQLHKLIQPIRRLFGSNVTTPFDFANQHLIKMSAQRILKHFSDLQQKEQDPTHKKTPCDYYKTDDGTYWVISETPTFPYHSSNTAGDGTYWINDRQLTTMTNNNPLSFRTQWRFDTTANTWQSPQGQTGESNQWHFSTDTGQWKHTAHRPLPIETYVKPVEHLSRSMQVDFELKNNTLDDIIAERQQAVIQRQQAREQFYSPPLHTTPLSALSSCHSSGSSNPFQTDGSNPFLAKHSYFTPSIRRQQEQLKLAAIAEQEQLELAASDSDDIAGYVAAVMMM